MVVMLVVTQYVRCLSNVYRILVVVYQEQGYHPIQQATIFGLITIPDHHVCHPSPECFGLHFSLLHISGLSVLR